MAEQFQHVQTLEPSFTCGIVCSPERVPLALRLKGKIPHAVIHIDTGRKGSWHTHREAMLNCTLNETHHVVLEEDTDVCANFIATVNAIIKAQPNKIISLFNFRSIHKGNDIANKQGRHFFTRDGSTGQGIIFPVKLMKEWISWSDSRIPANVPYEDTRLYAYLKSTRQVLWICVPNIVEHLLPSASLVDSKLNNKNRVSPDFIGTDVSGTEIDWSENIERVPTRAELKTNHNEFFQKWMGKAPPFS